MGGSPSSWFRLIKTVQTVQHLLLIQNFILLKSDQLLGYSNPHQPELTINIVINYLYELFNTNVFYHQLVLISSSFERTPLAMISHLTINKQSPCVSSHQSFQTPKPYFKETIHDQASLAGRSAQIQSVVEDKNKIGEELRNVVRDIEELIDAIDIYESERMFEIWNGEKGLGNLIRRCIDEDREIWLNLKTIEREQQCDKQNLDMNIQQNHMSENNQMVMSGLEKPSFIENNPEGIGQNDQFSCLSEMDILSPYRNLGSKSKREDKKQCMKRGSYKKYSLELKQHLVDLYRSGELSLNKIAKKYNVAIKNIKRWAQFGIQRKEGAGRKKLDEEMEYKVFTRIQETFQPKGIIKEQTIKNWALQECRFSTFKASRGWLNNFLKTYQLNELYTVV